jgi:excinuclease ABC subunit C
MNKEKLMKKKLPDDPGVYFFLGPKKEILYIGKATSLKSRVHSYFAKDIAVKRSKLIEQMVDEAKTVDVTVTDSVLEALILESNLIRTHKPKYNSISKDDKSYNHLVITREEFPRVLVVRGKDLTSKFTEGQIKYHFGPFTSGTLFKEALKIVRKLFKFYDTKVPVGKERSKMARGAIDFNKQIGLYPSEDNKKEYQRTIRYVTLFFQGKKKQVILELQKEMMALAQQERFEEADAVKRKIFALQHIQDVALIKDDSRHYRDDRTARIEAYDVAHMGGEDMVGVMTVVEGGEAKHHEYRKFKIKSVQGSNDTASLKEVLTRRLNHEEWPLPQIIVVDGSTAQKNAAEHVLKKCDMLIPVVAVVKDDKHRPIRLIASRKLLESYQNDILLANAESHRFALSYHKVKRNKRALS